MTIRTHYHVLGVPPDADGDRIRTAYRRLARVHHPDRVRSTSAVGGPDMPAINEAYRVLNDPGRRALYDRTIGGTTSPRSGSPAGPDHGDPDPRYRPELLRPARIPWRTLLVAGTVAVVGIVVLAQFSDGAREIGPDGILRNGDCIEIMDNSDAREIACTGDADLVVRAFIPFDGNCPGLTEPHRDRQGMGVACVDLPE